MDTRPPALPNARDPVPNRHHQSAVDCLVVVACCATCGSEVLVGDNRWARSLGGYLCCAAASYQITGLAPRGGEARAAADLGALAGRYVRNLPTVLAFSHWLLHWLFFFIGFCIFLKASSTLGIQAGSRMQPRKKGRRPTPPIASKRISSHPYSAALGAPSISRKRLEPHPAAPTINLRQCKPVPPPCAQSEARDTPKAQKATGQAASLIWGAAGGL
jgi:hypothetical protein